MRNKKEFFGVLLSVLVCVFLVVLVVYATTTIGNDITIGTDLTVTSGARIGTGTGSTHITELGDGTLFVEGDAEFDGTAYFDKNLAINMGVGTDEPATELSVVGTASISQDLWASGSFQFGGGESTATASYSRLGSGSTGHSLSNADDLLITGSVEVDGTAFFDGVVSVSDTNGLMVGGGAKMFGGTASPDFNCTAGSLYLKGGGTTFFICNPANTWNQVTLTTL